MNQTYHHHRVNVSDSDWLEGVDFRNCSSDIIFVCNKSQVYIIVFDLIGYYFYSNNLHDRLYRFKAGYLTQKMELLIECRFLGNLTNSFYIVWFVLFFGL